MTGVYRQIPAGAGSDSWRGEAMVLGVAPAVHTSAQGCGRGLAGRVYRRVRPSPRSGSECACLTLGSPSIHDMYMDLGRISVDHRIMGGVPCVAGTRIPVATVVGLVANGLAADEIMAEYPQLTREDVQACLGYAARAVDERELPVRLSA
jgi:uncharacterized protein (DUF433 family)